MRILCTYLNRQPRTLWLFACYSVAILCFLSLSANLLCANAAMPFPEKATASITTIDTTSGLITAKDSDTGQVFQFKLTNPMLLRSLNVGQAFFVDIGNKLVSFDGSRINGNIVSIGPVDPGKPLGPVDGVRPAGPVDGAKPAGSVDGVKPGVQKGPGFGPIDSAKPGQNGGGTNFGPIDSAKPSQTGGSTNFGPIDSAKPGQTGGGANSFGPIDSAKPLGPVDGAHPSRLSDGGVATCTITSIDSSRGLVTARENQSGRTFQFRPSNASFLQSLKPGQDVSANFASHQVSLMVNGQNPTTIGSIVSAMPPATQK